MDARLRLAAALLLMAPLGRTDPPPGPHFEGERLVFPADYREWVFLSAGYDMSYSPFNQAGHHMFDNVFVDPAAWRYFQSHGTWPDPTVLVLEVRGARTKGSINVAGSFQDETLMGVEVHLKDSTRFKDGWAFFGFGGDRAPAAMIPAAADCYDCHAKHASVDRTFVQFYPTLLPIAKARGTLTAPDPAPAKH